MSGVDSKKLKESIFDFAYNMALGDATARVSSKGKRKKLEKLTR